MKKVLLVVEDELAYAKLLHDKLESAGYEVFNAADGQAGLEMAKKEHPDLVLLDVRLPVMDGVTMLKKLRADPWGKDVVVFILSNSSESANISDAMSAKVSRYIIKSDTALEAVFDDIKLFLK